MKNTFLKTAALSLALFSTCAFADKIIITGTPVTLEKQGEIYIVPNTYTLAKDYQYVLINGEKRACFLDKRPDFVNVDVVSINVNVQGQNATWNCYSLSPTYFDIR